MAHLYPSIQPNCTCSDRYGVPTPLGSRQKEFENLLLEPINTVEALRRVGFRWSTLGRSYDRSRSGSGSGESRSIIPGDTTSPLPRSVDDYLNDLPSALELEGMGYKWADALFAQYSNEGLTSSGSGSSSSYSSDITDRLGQSLLEARRIEYGLIKEARVLPVEALDRMGIRRMCCREPFLNTSLVHFIDTATGRFSSTDPIPLYMETSTVSIFPKRDVKELPEL